MGFLANFCNGITSGTINTTLEVKTDTFNIAASPVPKTGLVKAKAELGDVGYDTWFKAVYSYVNTI